MKFFGSILALMLVSLGLGMLLPWWSIVIAGFLVGFTLPQKPFLSFLAGFTALFISWIGLAGWLSVQNGHILAKRMSALFLQQEQPVFLLLATAIVGAVMGGVATWSGTLVRRLFLPKS
jgi:hypothetical protein